MWWRKHKNQGALHNPGRRASIAALLALTACGLSPVYGPDSPASSLRGAISYDVPATVAGFRLRERLEERLGITTDPRYILTTTLMISSDSVAISEEGDITRVTLPGRADFTLRDTTGALITQGSVNSFASYSTTGTTVATQAAAEDAEARLAVILADLMVTRLLAASLP